MRRTLWERIYSAQQQARTESMKEGAVQLERFLTAAAEMHGWPVTKGPWSKPRVGETTFPSSRGYISELLVGSAKRPSGIALWNYQSAVVHSVWHGLSESIVEITPYGGLDEGLASAAIGTRADSVVAQCMCVVRVYIAAVRARMTFLGQTSAEWDMLAAHAEQMISAVLAQYA
jgi:hypothetical protein